MYVLLLIVAGGMAADALFLLVSSERLPERIAPRASCC